MAIEKNRKRWPRLAVLGLAIAFMALLPRTVSAEVTGFYEWRTINHGDEIEIKKYTGGEQTVRIPSKIDGRPVTSIYDYAFRENKYMEQVVIPDSVRSIGIGAFYGSALKSVKLPDSVTEVSIHAFSGCPNLESFDTGNGVRELWQVCQDCPKLTSIRIGSSLEEIDDTFVNATSLRSVTIPGTVKGIRHGFAGCSNLVSVELQEGIEYLTYGAFEGCAISSIKLPNSITSLYT